jgi:hypothetical protein
MAEPFPPLSGRQREIIGRAVAELGLCRSHAPRAAAAD